MPKTRRVKKFTRAECRRVQEKLRPKIEEVARQLGLQFTFGGGRLSDAEFSFKLQFTLNGEAQEDLVDAKRDEFEQYAPALGFKLEHYGREVPLYDGTYRIVGLKPGVPKNNTIIEKVRTRTGRPSTGKQFVCPHTEVLHALGETVSVGDYDVVD